MRSRLVEVGKDLTAGTMAGIAQLLVGHPFDTVKVKLQSQMAEMSNQTPKYTGAFDAVARIMATEGPGGFYRGLGAPLAAVALFNAVLFAARGQMEAFLLHNRKHPYPTLSVRQQMVAGVGAGVAVSFVACPTELIKCRLQAQSTASESPPPPPTPEQENKPPEGNTPQATDALANPNPNSLPTETLPQGDIGLMTLVVDLEAPAMNPRQEDAQQTTDTHVNPNPNSPSHETPPQGAIGLRTSMVSPAVDLEAPAINPRQRDTQRATETIINLANPNPNSPSTETLPQADIGLRTLVVDPDAPRQEDLHQLSSSHKYSGSLDVAKQIFRSEGGFLGFFKGLSPTFLREVFGNAAYFGSYQGTKQLLSRGGALENLSTGSLLVAGGVAGAMFWLCVYPADVIKSMIQVDDYRNPKYSSAFDAFRKVFKSQGMKGFYCGFGPAMARSVLANAVCFYVYELVRKAFK